MGEISKDVREFLTFQTESGTKIELYLNPGTILIIRSYRTFHENLFEYAELDATPGLSL